MVTPNTDIYTSMHRKRNEIGMRARISSTVYMYNDHEYMNGDDIGVAVGAVPISITDFKITVQMCVYCLFMGISIGRRASSVIFVSKISTPHLSLFTPHFFFSLSQLRKKLHRILHEHLLIERAQTKFYWNHFYLHIFSSKRLNITDQKILILSRMF